MPAQHAVKRKLLGPVFAAVVEQMGLLAVAAQAWVAAVAQLVLSWLVAAGAPVAAFVLVLSWPALSPSVVVPAADIGSPTAVEVPVAVVLVPAAAMHQWPLCLGKSVRTVPLHGSVGWTEGHI